jgi:hypothetical protein
MIKLKSVEGLYLEEVVKAITKSGYKVVVEAERGIGGGYSYNVSILTKGDDQ